MGESIISVYTSLPGQIAAGGSVIIGALSAVSAGIAVMKLAENRTPAIVLFLAAITAIQLAALPAILLAPGLYKSTLAGLLGVIYIIYIAAVMIKVGTLFPPEPAAALRRTLAPWIFAMLSISAVAPPSGIIAFLLEELSRTGLVCFTAFWTVFPLFFFSRRKVPPLSGRSNLMILPIVLTTIAGIYLVYRAWVASSLLRFVDIESCLLASGVLFQVADEVLTFRRLRNPL
jgi:hypothetical protein